MLDSLITSKTRIKLLMKFFLNPGTNACLRSLADVFGELANFVRVELNRPVEQAVSRLGKAELAFIAGDCAKGNDSGLIGRKVQPLLVLWRQAKEQASATTPLGDLSKGKSQI